MINREFEIKEITEKDQKFIEEMLYQSIYVPEGEEKFDRSIILEPTFVKYYINYGYKTDAGFLVVDCITQNPVGAAWLRLFGIEEKGWGFVSEDIPELSIAIDYNYRGKGLGTLLLKHLLENTNDKYSKISLSVDKTNRAKILYERFGFMTVDASGNSITMLLKR